MSIVSTAESYIGKVRYDFGEDDIDGGVGDCSSFTQTVFRKNGIEIGRDTKTQWTNGTEVKKSDLKAGDLVFFQNTYRKGVSHVGIYIGDGKFIHNSSTKGVTTGDLNSDYWKSHWLGGRRVSSSGGSTTNPTYTAEEVKTDSSFKLDVAGQIVKFIVIISLIILAVVFFFNAFGVSATDVATDTIKKKVTKTDE